MKRPVGASSTEARTSANDRFGNGSLWSGPTSVMFMPGTLGKVPGGSPVPTGGGPGLGENAPSPAPSAKGGGPAAGAGASIDGKVFGGGLNAALAKGERPGTLGSAVVPGAGGSGAG